MKQHTSRLYVMSLALASGVSFDNAYGIDDLHVKATADLPQSSGRAGQCGEEKSNWIKTAVRLSEAVRRVVRNPLSRRAVKV